MADKEIIEEMVNMPTEQEQRERARKGKEKDDLIQALLHYATAEASGGIKSLIDCEGCAFYLYEMLGYRKIDKDSVVISKEEHERLEIDSLTKSRLTFIDRIEIIDKARKEVIEEIREMVKQKSFSTWFNVDDNPRKEILVSLSDIDKIIKSLGVDIEE